MKKTTLLALTLAATSLVSCDNKPAEQNKGMVDDAVIVFDQGKLKGDIKVQMDSLAADFCRLKSLPIFKQDGKFKLNSVEKQIKPQYLLEASIADTTATTTEKYRILSALSVDNAIAKLYDMKTADYDKGIKHLTSEIDDSALKAVKDSDRIYKTSAVLYQAMEEKGHINYFWHMAAASLTEQLYIASQKPDIFLRAFDEDKVEDVTFRISILVDAVNRLSKYDSELQFVSEAIAPLSSLNAISEEDFRNQLIEEKPEIEAARKALIFNE